jgi:hypothetical protein
MSNNRGQTKLLSQKFWRHLVPACDDGRAEDGAIGGAAGVVYHGHLTTLVATAESAVLLRSKKGNFLVARDL